VAVFDGSVRVVDLEKRKTTFHGTEHKNRVWTIENTNPACFASCADDGYIKLWDIRIPPKSTFTIRDNEKEKARVSVLLQLDNNQLVSGSCPDDVRNTHNKAQFSFWDIRRLA
jgi:WD40 repeat protein